MQYEANSNNEGHSEDEIRKKASNYVGVHSDTLTLVDFGEGLQ